MITLLKSIDKNLILFFISTFVSKSISILLLPIYSRSLSISEYGHLDVYLTMLMLLLPIVTAALYESVLKYSLEGKFRNKEIISTALTILCVNTVVLLLFSGIIYLYNSSISVLIFLAILFFMSVFEILCKFSNGTERTIIYAKSNIIVSITLAIGVYSFVYNQNYGLDGVLISYLVSYFLGIVYLTVKLSIRKEFSFFSFNYKVLKQMLSISAPLIPNAVMWWIFNAGDRLMILYFSGSDEVGLYSVSNKVSALVMVCHTVIFQYWQVRAVKERGNLQFYSSVCQSYYLFMLCVVSFMISINQDLLALILTDEYSMAWEVGNWLVFSSLFFSLASFIGVFFVVYNATKIALKTSIYAAVVNVIFNFLLIPQFGAYGAAISTLISTVFILCSRLFPVLRIIKIKLDSKIMLILPVLIFLQIISIIAIEEYLISYLLSALFFFFLIRDLVIRFKCER
ncbi:polysaccharide biosynthesis C-terminal domain-containing protein [Vibrio cyclitrophicus]|uniref:oligosaccharide flippase family protein n=1 Tax=Vibrio cyclitrophicus TaxID=47951 RepID=UPI000C81C2F7|nr:polysaccharide biosynthesis C-terminal domain-containing protein [Vibrio cyclitrophicus]PME75367.1 hypothetical protein BCV29_18640 [Vibrio cyclitrophicus]